MSKGKYKRKQESTDKSSVRKPRAIGSNNGVVAPAETSVQVANAIQSGAKQKKEGAVGFREAIKKSSITDWLLATFTLALFGVGIYQYIALSGQLKVLRQDQRPWIKLSFDASEIKTGSPVIGKVRVINSGKTPAFGIAGDVCVERVEKGQEPLLDCKYQKSRFTTGVLFPNAGDNNVPVIPIENTHRSNIENMDIVGDSPYPLDQPTIDDFKDGKFYFVTYLDVRYTDSASAEHWTKACQFVDKIGYANAKKCTDYNSADTN